MIHTTTEMKLAHFHDFYYLQALDAAIRCEIASSPTLEFSHAIERLKHDVEIAKQDIFPNMALRVFAYMYAACVGEARHSREDCAKTHYIPALLQRSRSDAFTLSTKFAPTTKNIQALVDIFAQPWSSGFGGEAWKEIAEALFLYFTLPPAAFLDYVVDLEHNNGTVFSKDDARITLQFSVQYPASFKAFLDYKFRYNILEVNYGSQLDVTSRIHRLVKRFTTIFRKPDVWWIKPTLDALGLYSVEWENRDITIEKKWAYGVDVSLSNKPSLNHVLEMLDFDFSIKGWSKTKITKFVNTTKKEVKPFARMLTKEQQEKVWEKINKWHNFALKMASLSKTPTYSIVPVKAKFVGSNMEIQFPIPHFGYGQKTEYGFTITINPNTLIVSGIKEAQTEKGYDGQEKYADGHFHKHYGQLLLKIEKYSLYIQEPALEVLFD